MWCHLVAMSSKSDVLNELSNVDVGPPPGGYWSNICELGLTCSVLWCVLADVKACSVYIQLQLEHWIHAANVHGERRASQADAAGEVPGRRMYALPTSVYARMCNERLER